jgi:AGCS family alanine or glycine:cation symporter
MTVDQQINDFFAPVSEFALGTVLYSVNIGGIDIRLLVLWFIVAAVFFTLYLGFVNFRHFRHGLACALGKFDDEKDDGQINSFQALMASLSGTVGLGNIAGVAAALSVGGAGAIFWMVVMGLLNMSVKFAEVTLGVAYRQHEDKDDYSRLYGGPMYYLRDGLAKKGLAVPGKILGIMFALCCIAGAIGGGNMFQANQAFQQVVNITGGETGFMADKGWLFGIGLSVLVGIVIIGGIKSIAAVASRIVPFMGIMYVCAALVVLAVQFDHIPGAFGQIFDGAFTLKAGLGGLVGGLLIGVQRAAFSNESGLGTAAIVYAAARAHHPVAQGMASMIGPFIDTVVVCTATALVILVSDMLEHGNGIEGVELTSRAFATGLSWFPYMLALAVFLFAYSTLITFAYYGVKCLTFIFGQNDALEMGFKVVFCLFTIIGASMNFGRVIDLTDALILSMAIPNIIGLYILAPEIKALMTDYIKNEKPKLES